MTKLTSTLCFLLVVSLACVARCDDDDREPALITVTGTGIAKGTPEEVVVSVGIQLRNNTVEDVSSEVDSKSAAVIAYLKDQNVSDSDIQTSYVTLSPYYSYDSSQQGKTTPDYYTATKTLTFSLKNLSSYDEIMTNLYDLGINSVNSVNFNIRNATQRQQEARRSAVRNAKQIAQTLMSGLGARLGRVYKVSESTTDGSSEPPVFFYAAKSLAAVASGSSGVSSGPSISSGQVEITSSVTVSFYIIN